VSLSAPAIDLCGETCRECLEVKCRSASVPDGGGDTLNRTGLCLNDKSVKVKIVDTCPCNYPANAASNKRWCCGDYPHLDLSQWALEKVCRFSAAQQQGHVWRSCIQTCWRGLCLASRCCCMPLV